MRRRLRLSTFFSAGYCQEDFCCWLAPTTTQNSKFQKNGGLWSSVHALSLSLHLVVCSRNLVSAVDCFSN